MSKPLEIFTIPPKSGETDACVVLFHGLGANGYQFEGIPSMLSLDNPNIAFVCPHAPFRPISLNHGLPANAWYDAYRIAYEWAPQARDWDEKVRMVKEEMETLINLAQLEELYPSLDQLMVDVLSEVPANRVIVGGFSQGASIAYALLPHLQIRLGGVLGLSGYVTDLQPKSLPKEAYETPLFIAHGADDEVVLPQAAHIAVKYFSDLGFPVTFQEYSGMEHNLGSRRLISDLSQFINQALPPLPKTQGDSQP